MRRDYTYGIVDFATYMELVDMGKVLPINRSVTKLYSSVFATYVPSRNSVGKAVIFSKLQCSQCMYHSASVGQTVFFSKLQYS